MTRRTRFALALSAAAVVVAVAVVVLVGGRSGDPDVLPVRAGGDPAATTAEAGAAADAAIAPAPAGGGVIWNVADGLPALDGEAPAYRVADVDEGDVAALADRLGLAGEVRRDGETWRVADGTRVLDVAASAGSWWSLYTSDPAAGAGVSGSTGSAGGTTDGEIVEVEPAPVPPDADPVEQVDPVSEDEARAVALDVASALGIDTADAEVAVDDGGAERIVRIDPAVDGLPTWGLTTYVAVGANGEVSWANGTVLAVERVDAYPLVGTAVAADRLGQGIPGQPVALGSGAADTGVSSEAGEETAASATGCDPALGADGDAATRDGCPRETAVEPADEACDDTVEGTEGLCAAPADDPCDAAAGTCVDPAQVPACDPAVGGDGDAATEDGCGPILIDPLPCEGGPAVDCASPEPLPEPEPVDVEVTGVRLGLAVVPAVDGSSTWLVPAYLWDVQWPGAEVPSVEVTLAVADEFLLPAGG